MAPRPAAHGRHRRNRPLSGCLLATVAATAVFYAPSTLRAWVASRPVEVWSFNLRNHFQDENDGPDGWSKRRAGVADFIMKRKPDLICVQEGAEPMTAYLADQTDGEYVWVGTSRTPGLDDEAMGYLFNRNRLSLRARVCNWLAPEGTPAGQPGWDAMCPRTFEAAVFEVKDSEKENACPLLIRALNTHLDHVGVEARTKSGELIAQAIRTGEKEWPGCAHILCGDFNSPKGGGNEVYKVLTAAQENGGGGLNDAARLADEVVRNSEIGTIHKFKGTDFAASMGDGTVDLSVTREEGVQLDDSKHIDWMFFRQPSGGNFKIKPSKFEVITDKMPSGRYPSDHYPLSVKFDFEG